MENDEPHRHTPDRPNQTPDESTKPTEEKIGNLTIENAGWQLDCLTEGYEAVMIRPPWLFGPENTMGRILEPVAAGLQYDLIDSLPANCSNDDLPKYLLLWTHPTYAKLGDLLFAGWGYSQPHVIRWWEAQQAPSEFRHERESFYGPIVNSEDDVQERSLLLVNDIPPHPASSWGPNRPNGGRFIAPPAEGCQIPEKAYQLVESMVDAPRLEILTDSGRDGWDSYEELHPESDFSLWRNDWG